MDSIQIVPMSQEHLRQIHNIECECFAVPWSAEAFAEELLNPAAIYFVAMADGAVAGFAGMWHVLDEGHITNIAVRSTYRRRGIANALVARLTDIARARRMRGITLEVRMGNAAAQRLYGKHGFVFEGLRKNYYSDTKEDAVIMWKHFEMEVAR